jgi:hypothetical protein
VAIVFADDQMALERDISPDRRSWPDFVVDISQRCQDARRRFLPLQLTESAWPLHEELRRTNFIRAHEQKPADCDAFIARRIVVEICRYLRGHERGTQLPVEIFLSHAKQDISEGGVFNDVRLHLDATQPVSGWIDSGRIQPGKDFAAAIEQGIRDTAVLALVIDHYSSRPWCRREVLYAKKHRWPFVVVNALTGVDIRAFPYRAHGPAPRCGGAGFSRGDYPGLRMG